MMPQWRVAMMAALVVFGLVGCAAQPAPAPPAPRPHVHLAARELGRPASALSFAVYGDSISAWDPPFALNPAQSWTNTARSDSLHRVGGWALPGAKLSAMLQHAEPVDADFIVIMGGTNDMYYGTPIPVRLRDIDLIVATTAAHRVVLSAVAPYNPDPALAVTWNMALRQHAEDEGWLFMDPWSSVRVGDRWAVGADHGDGVHPNPASAAAVGRTISHFLWRLAHPARNAS